MSREWRDRWLGAAIGVISLAATAGTAWATMSYTLHDKLDASRYVVDSVSRDATTRDMARQLGEIREGMASANKGLHKLICRLNPHDSVCQ